MKMVSLSSFTRAPRRVLPLLDEGDVILTRKDAPALVLSVLPSHDDAPAGAADPSRAGSTPTDDVEPGPAEAGKPSEPLGLHSPPIPVLNDGDSDPTTGELGALLSALLAAIPTSQLAEVLPSCCPWMNDLPPAVRRSVVNALSATGTSDGSDGPGRVLQQWRARCAQFAHSSGDSPTVQ